MASCRTCSMLYADLHETLTALEPTDLLEPSPWLQERTLSQIDKLPRAEAAKGTLWTRLWKPALAAAAALLVLFLVLNSRPERPGVAFADVARNLSVFRPYSYTVTWERGDKSDGAPNYVFVMSPEISRVEYYDGRVIIQDNVNDEELYLWPHLKKAFKHIHRRQENEIQLSIYDIVDKWRSSEITPEFLGSEWMDGKPCSVFRSKDERYDATIWVDNRDGMPVRFEMLEISHGAKSGDMLINSNFQFDIEIDPALYSLDPPTEYTFGVLTHETPSEPPEGDTKPFLPYSYLSEVEQEGKRKVNARTFVLSPGLRRDEYPNGNIRIIDLGKGIELTLLPKTHQAAIRTFPPYIDLTLLVRRLDERINSLARFNWGPENIGSCIIDGKNCTGYYATDFTHVEQRLWVDDETQLPVLHETKQWDSNRTLIQSEFQLGIDTDPARFSLEPPPDYVVHFENANDK